MADKEKTLDVGIGYKASYKDKESGKDVTYLRLYIRPDQLATVVPDEKGNLQLTAFLVDASTKKSDKSPDLVIKPSIVSKKGSSGAAPRSAAKNSFPF